MDQRVLDASYTISTDPARFDIDAIHAYLSNDSYWCAGIPRETLERAVRNSIGAGAFLGGAQVGFASAATDRATFAWVCDVYVLEGHRGKGLAQAMVRALLAHPELQGLRRWVLATRDAHEVYRRVGFEPLPNAQSWMAIVDREVYSRRAGA